MAATSSARVTQLIHCRPDPSRPPRPTLNGRAIRGRTPPLLSRTSEVRRRATRMPAAAAGTVADSQARHNFSEEAGARPAGLRQLLIAAIAVVPDGRARHEHRGPVGGGGQGVGQQRSALAAAFEDLALLRGVPAAPADALAGQVDDPVQALEVASVELPGERIPGDRAGAIGGAHDGDHDVAVGLEPDPQRAAHQPTRPGDGDPHDGYGTGGRTAGSVASEGGAPCWLTSRSSCSGATWSTSRSRSSSALRSRPSSRPSRRASSRHSSG